MLYSVKYNFIYLKTTKTASSTAECALEYLIRGEFNSHGTPFILYPDGSRIGYRGMDPKNDPNYGKQSFSFNHMNAVRIKNTLGSETFDKSIKISSIRHPYSRCISAFHHFGQQPIELHEQAKKENRIYYTKNRFKKYIIEEEIVKDPNRHFYINEKLVVDLFIKQENFEQDLRAALKAVKSPSETTNYILKNYISNKVSIRSKSSLVPIDYYTNEILKIVNELYANWFDLGNYQMVDDVSQLNFL